MTPDRETLRIIGSWMEDGRTRLPDHVLDGGVLAAFERVFDLVEVNM